MEVKNKEGEKNEKNFFIINFSFNFYQLRFCD